MASKEPFQGSSGAEDVSTNSDARLDGYVEMHIDAEGMNAAPDTGFSGEGNEPAASPPTALSNNQKDPETALGGMEKLGTETSNRSSRQINDHAEAECPIVSSAAAAPAAANETEPGLGSAASSSALPPNMLDDIRHFLQEGQSESNHPDKHSCQTHYDDDRDDSSVNASIMETDASSVGECEALETQELHSVVARKDRELARLRVTMHQRDVQSEKTIQDLQKQIKKLKEENARLRARLEGPSAASKTTWTERLQKLLAGEDEAEEAEQDAEDDGSSQNDDEPPCLDWDDIYQLSCRQGNMSQNPLMVHPELKWSQDTLSPGRLRYLHELRLSRTAQLLGNGPQDIGSNNQVIPPGLPRFRFNDLPINIQRNIIERIFVKPGLIHCLSRLDKWNKPASGQHFPMPCSGTSGLPHRFAYGSQQTSVTGAYLPSLILVPLLVCKRWLYLGVHAFYGLNTFAFSSLGEFGRFFEGIGESRAQRVAHVELLWQGSIKPRHESRINQRTLPLMWLTRMRRLQTLAIFIEESAERNIRRRYEFPKVQEPKRSRQSRDKFDFSDRYKDWSRTRITGLNAPRSLLKRTQLQPNWRGNRSMRTTQGMDFVYQLRGMAWVRFYTVGSERSLIRDWSFIDDINSVATMPKDHGYAVKSNFRNLDALTGLADYIPSDQDQAMVAGFYESNTMPSVYPSSITSSIAVPDSSIPTSSIRYPDEWSDSEVADSIGLSHSPHHDHDSGVEDLEQNDIDFSSDDSGDDKTVTSQKEDLTLTQLPNFDNLNLRETSIRSHENDDRDSLFVRQEYNDITGSMKSPQPATDSGTSTSYAFIAGNKQQPSGNCRWDAIDLTFDEDDKGAIGVVSTDHNISRSSSEEKKSPGSLDTESSGITYIKSESDGSDEDHQYESSNPIKREDSICNFRREFDNKQIIKNLEGTKNADDQGPSKVSPRVIHPLGSLNTVKHKLDHDGGDHMSQPARKRIRTYSPEGTPKISAGSARKTTP